MACFLVQDSSPRIPTAANIIVRIIRTDHASVVSCRVASCGLYLSNVLLYKLGVHAHCAILVLDHGDFHIVL